MNNMDYWTNRERIRNVRRRNLTDEQIIKQLEKSLKQALDEVEGLIQEFYFYNSGEDGNIDEVKAMLKVTKKDIEYFRKKAKEYVEGAHSLNDELISRAFSEQAKEELRLYNATMRLNRLEMLKAEIGLELVRMANDDEAFLIESFKGYIYEEYERLAGVLGMKGQFKKEWLEQIILASFHGATFSSRIWNNQRQLKLELDKLLSTVITQGKNPAYMIKHLREKFGVTEHQAKRLAVTETTRIQSDIFLKVGEEHGEEWYEWIAEPGRCKLCGELDGKLTDGTFAPPRHPNCRCSLAYTTERIRKGKEKVTRR